MSNADTNPDTLGINMHKSNPTAYNLSKYYYQENFLGYQYLMQRRAVSLGSKRSTATPDLSGP